MKETFSNLIMMLCLHSASQFSIPHCSMFHKETDHVTHIWNKTDVSPMDYQRGYCSMRCIGETRVNLRRMSCWYVECATCYCQRPACEIYNICCPDISVPYIRETSAKSLFYQRKPSLRNSSYAVEKPERLMPKLGCERYTLNTDTFLSIISCLPDYRENQTVIRMCEGNFSREEETIQTFVRVVDMETHVVYKNMFCAQCHGVRNFSALPTVVKMSSYDAFFKARNKGDIVRLVSKSKIELFISFPDNITTFDCIFDKQVIDDCSSSNHSMEQDVVDACEELPHTNLYVYDVYEAKLYKNIFCAICNMNSYPEKAESCICHVRPLTPEPLPYSLLLDLRQQTQERHIQSLHREQTTPHCAGKEWLSPDRHCLPLNCAVGKEFDEGQCHEAIDGTEGLSYRSRVWLKPPATDRLSNESRNHKNDLMATKKLISNISKLLQGRLSHDFIIDLQGFRNRCSEVTALEDDWYLITIYLISPRNLSRNKFETEILSRFFDHNFKVETSENISSILQWQQSLTLENQIIGTHSCDLECVKEQYVSEKVMFASTDNEFLFITRVLMCPHVRLDKWQYHVTINDSILPPIIEIEIDLNVTTINITDKRDLTMIEIDGDEMLNVCQDFLDSKLKEFSIKEQEDLSENWNTSSRSEYIVSLACFAASSLCLLLTLMTYSMFQVLRTEAGVNNMFLSASLLFAQVLLLLSSHWYSSSSMCTVLGIATHFLWLWMFSWSAICSYHMLRVFTASTRSSIRQKNMARHLKRLAISLVCPTIMVAFTLLYSYMTSHGETLGYGRYSCYLNTTLLIGVTVVGPLCAITISNILFFIITAHTIYKVRNLQSSYRHDDQQSHWNVYVRLSSITGAFWTVAVLDAVLEYRFLKFSSILLNGLQGVAIFISFICNKRVWYLYTQRRQVQRTSN
nr:putative adhesion G protein-coupled receptor E4P [Biomphalaria glabrata]